jgi:GGDEF domain-containing protein
MAVLRKNYTGLDEVLAQMEGDEFMCRMERIQKAAETAQAIWASLREGE